MRSAGLARFGATSVRESAAWRGQWVLLQYTALGWSRRGFPIAALLAVAILRLRGARCAILFHEPSGAAGPRLIDRIRCAFQDWTVRALHRLTEKSVFTVPLDAFPWLSHAPGRAVYIPLAPNIPENLTPRTATSIQNDPRKTVVVFCVSGPPHQQREVGEIAYAARAAVAAGIQLRVIFLGRGTVEAKVEIDRAFHGTPIEVCNLGIVERTEVTRIFSESDAMPARVRGKLYLRRGSALAGLACGLPIFGYAGGVTSSTFIEEAGIALVPFADLAGSWGRALQDPHQSGTLAGKCIKRCARPARIPFVGRDRAQPMSNFSREIRLKIKLLLYSHDWFPLVGGVQTVTLSLATGLAEWGKNNP